MSLQQSKQSEVMEIATFKTKEGVTRKHFLGTIDAVSRWAEQQPGFISRNLTYATESDTWIDVIWWESLDAAETAMQVAETSESCAPMFAAIDMESIQMLHGERVVPTVVAKRESVGA